MKKRKVMGTKEISFREGCEAYLLDCRQRNLRVATLNHYRQSYQQFYKYIAIVIASCQIKGQSVSLDDFRRF